jgi:hypothetical protein
MKLLWIFQLIFGCRHSQRSSVFTIKQRTYQACLECGREFEYSWARMHSIPSSVTDRPYAPLNSARHSEAAVL